MGRESSPNYVTRNVFERANGYPSRFGTARRDEYGQLLDGEFDGKGRRMQTAADGLQGGKGLTSQEDWNDLFPNASTVAARNGTPTPSAGSGQPSSPSGGNPFVAAGATGAGAKNDVNAAGNAVPPASVIPASGGQQAQQPAIGSTRRTAFGGTETLMPSQSGPRWVGSVAGAPAPNNMRPGEAATASLADHRVVAYDPAPNFQRDKNGVPVDSPEQIDRANKAWYASNMGKHTVSTTEAPADRPISSPFIQGQLNAGTPAANASAAIAANGGRVGEGRTPFGDVKVQSGEQIAQDRQTDRQLSKKAPAAGRGVTVASVPAAAPANPAPAAAPGMRPNPFVPAVPAAPAQVGAPAALSGPPSTVRSRPGSTYSPMESPSTAYERQQANAGDRQRAINDAVKRRMAALQADADAKYGPGAAPAGKTAFGIPTVPVKPARPVAPKRADKKQKVAWNN